MTSNPRRIFVLGAGFTRAFVPSAPLLNDDYYGDELEKKFREFPHASRILALERSRNREGHIDIERLMTRLDGRMPYDSEQRAEEEIGLLLREVKRCFVRRLEEARGGQRHAEELEAFARYCLNNGIACVTFNYDDFFDQALWEIKRVESEGRIELPYWHPDGGYGFYCKPSIVCIRDVSTYMDELVSILFLKLHGSVNWRIRRGFPHPFSVDAIVHHEEWFPYPPGLVEPDTETIELHLERESFIVPPVLLKSALVEQPILGLVWSLAYEELAKADEITFIGYSLPITDLAATFLFSEAVQERVIPNISVVNYPSNNEVRNAIMDSYKRVFPGIRDEQFDFRDALEWSNELMATEGGES